MPEIHLKSETTLGELHAIKNKNSSLKSGDLSQSEMQQQ